MSFLERITKAWHDLFDITGTPEQKTASLDTKAKLISEHLDWRHSIVDLLKLTGQDSSLQARAALAKELGYQATFTGTGTDNNWLHAKVMEHLKV